MVESNRVYVHGFTEAHNSVSRYWRDIGTLDAYWEANMDLCLDEPQCNLSDKKWPIRTFQEQVPPARIVRPRLPDTDGEDDFRVVNSILSGGCVISGAHVEHSVLSHDVRVNQGAAVSESVILDGVTIGHGARIKKAIIDEHVAVPARCTIGYDEEFDRSRFAILARRSCHSPRPASVWNDDRRLSFIGKVLSWRSMTMPDVSVRGRRLAYGVQPLEFDRSDPAVVFIHGSGGDREDWRAQLDGLSSALTAIALELPAMGSRILPAKPRVPGPTPTGLWISSRPWACNARHWWAAHLAAPSRNRQRCPPRPWLKAIGLVGAGARLKVLPALLQGLLSEPESTMRMIGEFCLSQSAPRFHAAGNEGETRGYICGSDS